MFLLLFILICSYFISGFGAGNILCISSFTLLLLSPSKHKTFEKQLYNVGPTSKTLGRRCIYVIKMFCVCWGVITMYINCVLDVKLN